MAVAGGGTAGNSGIISFAMAHPARDALRDAHVLDRALQHHQQERDEPQQHQLFFNFLQGLEERLSVVLLEDLAETMEEALEDDGDEDYNRADDGDDPCRSVLQRYVRLVASSGHGSR